jgi:hypothetical protein
LPIRCDFWGITELDKKVKGHSDIVSEFFDVGRAPIPPPKEPSDILKPNTAERPDAGNPGTLLNARYQVVPFFEDTRLQELEVLESWCGSADPFSVRLFVGPGGSGKTRLFIEWANDLRQRGWHAGFLSDPVTSAGIEALLASQLQTLIVVDYAESHPDLLGLLRRVASRPARAGTLLRIALLARQIGDWWESLRTQDADVSHLLAHHEPVALATVPVEGTLRQRPAGLCESARENRSADERGPGG